MKAANCLEIDNVRNAAANIKSRVQRTPICTSSRISKIATKARTSGFKDGNLNINFVFKYENMQTTGSFKFRGATNFMLNLSDDELRRGIVTYSTGNHAAATACAAKTLSIEKGFLIPCTVVMPEYAAASKAEAARCHNARVLLHGSSIVNCSQLATKIQQATGATLTKSSGHADIILGQGTAVLELLDQVENADLPPLDAVVLPCGSGGLLTGAGIVCEGLPIRVFGAEPAKGGPDLERGLKEDQHVTAVDPFATIADGLRTPVSKFTWEYLRLANFIDGVYATTDEQIKVAMRLLLEELRVCIEPSAAVPLAVIMYNQDFRRDLARVKNHWTIGIILTGGNTTVKAMIDILGQQSN